MTMHTDICLGTTTWTATILKDSVSMSFVRNLTTIKTPTILMRICLLQILMNSMNISATTCTTSTRLDQNNSFKKWPQLKESSLLKSKLKTRLITTKKIPIIIWKCLCLLRFSKISFSHVPTGKKQSKQKGWKNQTLIIVIDKILLVWIKEPKIHNP